MLIAEFLVVICVVIHALINALVAYWLKKRLGNRMNKLRRKQDENPVLNGESEKIADPDPIRKWIVVPLRVVYLIYAVPLFVLVGVIFIVNTVYDIFPQTMVLCFTFPLILSLLLISIISILQHWLSWRK